MRYYGMSDLVAHGIDVPAAGDVFIDREIPLEQIATEGVILHQGVRVEGRRSVLSTGVELGREGPVVARHVGLGPGARIDRGSASDCALLAGAVLGPDAHVRVGTLLEEQANTAHAVGLKQTILMPFVTLGSQINFCDVLMAGGRSRQDHSEVGSGFIHFNYTPFGETGDKATASLLGDVPQGVLLDSDRIFLGGAGGVVGPVRVGYGTVLAAGCVYRRDYDSGLLVYAEQLPARSTTFDPLEVRGIGRRLGRTREYLGQLFALHAFYRFVRMPREIEALPRQVLEFALAAIESGIVERIKQGDRLLAGAGNSITARDGDEIDRWRQSRTAWLEERPDGDVEPFKIVRASALPGQDHLSFMAGLDPEVKSAVKAWLSSVAEL